MEEKNSLAQNRQKEVKLFQEAFGLSEQDSEALLAQTAEVQTTDVIPLDQLNENAKVDSTTTTLNNLHDENTLAILNRNAPRE